MDNGKPKIDLTDYILEENTKSQKNKDYWEGYNAAIQRIIEKMSVPLPPTGEAVGTQKKETAEKRENH